MQGFEVSGFAVRRPFENGFKYCRTFRRTVTGQFAENSNKNIMLKVSGELSGAVRLALIARCLSGCVSLGRAAPDTRTKQVKTEATQ